MSGSPLAQLRKLVADTLADAKAYELPALCKRYGLSDGPGDEAFQGKFRYAMRRISPLPEDELVRVAQSVFKDFPSPALGELIAKVQEPSQLLVSEITRRKVIEALNPINLGGQLDIVEMLEPVFPLDEFPSMHPTAGIFDAPATIRDDIYRHCVRNDDWTNSDLLTRLDILTCSQQRFFSVLERLMHPVVRGELEQKVLAGELNEILRRDGYALIVSGDVSGYPIYSVRRITKKGSAPPDQSILERLEQFDEAGIHALWEKAIQRRKHDAEGAITIARTLLESSCKNILEELKVQYPRDADLPKLWALCAEQLNLAPSQHTETVFKGILGNCQSIVNYIGTIRNRLGDSHGQGGRPIRPKPRHAELVVNLAGSMAMFLLETWLERKQAANKKDVHAG
jgi:hypothetical protein